MNRILKHGISYWTFENLSQYPVVHFVTGKEGGEGGNFNLGLKAGLPGQGAANREILSELMGIGEGKLFIPSQTHGANVQVVTNDTISDKLQDTDALITAIPGICVAVLSADCVPVVVYDKRQQVVAAIHAGWRGTVARIVQKTIQGMKARFNSRGEDIVAGIGPSICQEVYEVGLEVVDQVEQAFGKDAKLVKQGAPGKGYPDLWRANLIQLLEEGVPERNIEVAEICTFTNSDNFFSARKEPAGTGRFASGIMLR